MEECWQQGNDGSIDTWTQSSSDEPDSVYYQTIKKWASTRTLQTQKMLNGQQILHWFAKFCNQ